TPALLIIGLVPELRLLSSYFVPLAWALAAGVTLRFIYMSHVTVRIHMKRAKFGVNSNAAYPAQHDEDEEITARDTTDLSPFNSSDVSPMVLISRIAKKRMQRRTKFINSMTRVEEERTNAFSRTDEPFSMMEKTDEISKSAAS